MSIEAAALLMNAGGGGDTLVPGGVTTLFAGPSSSAVFYGARLAGFTSAKAMVTSDYYNGSAWSNICFGVGVSGQSLTSYSGNLITLASASSSQHGLALCRVDNDHGLAYTRSGSSLKLVSWAGSGAPTIVDDEAAVNAQNAQLSPVPGDPAKFVFANYVHPATQAQIVSITSNSIVDTSQTTIIGSGGTGVFCSGVASSPTKIVSINAKTTGTGDTGVLPTFSGTVITPGAEAEITNAASTIRGVDRISNTRAIMSMQSTGMQLIDTSGATPATLATQAYPVATFHGVFSQFARLTDTLVYGAVRTQVAGTVSILLIDISSDTLNVLFNDTVVTGLSNIVSCISTPLSETSALTVVTGEDGSNPDKIVGFVTDVV